MKVLIILLACTVLISQSGCFAPVSLQSGRTIGKGNSEMFFNASLGKFLDHTVPYRNRTIDINAPIVEIGRTFGLTPDLDVWLKANLITYVSLGAKYQYAGTKTSLFALAVGVEAGTAPLAIPNSFMVSYISAPVYLSVHPGETSCFYLTPRYIYGSNYVFNEESRSPGFHTSAELFGLSYGLILGKTHRISVEVSHFYKNLIGPSQFSVGYTFPL